MKTMTKLGAVLVGASLLTGAAFAGDGHHGGRKGAMKAAMLEKFDTNKDGKLDDAEKAAAKAQHEQKRAERMAQFDTNKDGKLDDAERKVAKDARVAERFKKLDTNNDGILSIDEFKAGAEQMHGRRGGGFRK